MLTSSNPTEQQDSLDSSCRGLEAPDKAATAASKKDAAVKVVADDMKAKIIEDSGVLVSPEPTKEGAANINNKKAKGNIGCLVMVLDEAKRMLLQAQKEVKIKEDKVIELEKRLAEVLERSSAQSQPLKKEDISEEERRAAVRRRWRILGMKVRIGISANIVKKRKINDPNSFIVKETEAVKKADELDLEGACKRKTKVRGKWRRAGFGAGITLGKDNF